MATLNLHFDQKAKTLLTLNPFRATKNLYNETDVSIEVGFKASKIFRFGSQSNQKGRFMQPDIHHSFSINVAQEHGIEQAILIHHFQYWVQFNKRKNSARHFRDGCWWTYQTREEIKTHLPYLSEKAIRWHCDKLIEKGILKKHNYNKSKIDKTLWYAFVHEEVFLGSPQKSPTTAVNGSRDDVKGKAIPDPKPDTKKDSSSPPHPKRKEEEGIFKEEIRKSLPNVSPQEFHRSWLAYESRVRDESLYGPIKSPAKWIMADIDRHRGEEAILLKNKEEKELHRVQALFEENQWKGGVGSIVACPQYLELVRGSHTRIVNYDVSKEEWEEKTGWKQYEKVDDFKRRPAEGMVIRK